MIYTGLNGSGEVEAVYAAKRATTTGTPPLSYPSKGYDLEDFLISGNTIQNGTPTPSNPVDVVGCGIWDETQQSYKLPLTVNGTEHPIYLGQVQTTRKIKKLVLTGEENWTITSNGVLRIGLSGQLRPSIPLCTHYLGSNSTAWANLPDKSVTVSIAGYLAILDTTYTTAADFKSYLAQQYAAGTPVTVWYVLAEPETAITNEPFHKIGDYADTISLSQSGITVPTTKGVNTITTETTVLPSSISVTTPEKEVAEVYAGINYQNPIYYKTRTITGQAPLSYKALSKPLSDYLISGNTVQNGTPTPSSLIYPEECGERTGNLFDYQTMAGTIKEYYLDIYGELQPGGMTAVTDYIPCSGGSFALDKIGGISPSICLYDENKQFLYGKAYNTPSGSDKQTIIVDTSFNASFIRFSYFYRGAPCDDLSAIMLNSGSTPLHYEPYGYKLPLTVNNTEHPIYLGQVQTTRKIKKLVLTGNESWNRSTTYTGSFYAYFSQFPGISGYSELLCTHLQNSDKQSYQYSRCTCDASSVNVWLFNTSTSLADFKSYLAAQYAAGTPVTIWYVLAEPETGIVNEPLHKIGNYADTVSFAQAGVTIPTVAGTNTLTVDTTVQPSEVSITGNIKLI